jgi:hypothetical protein
MRADKHWLSVCMTVGFSEAGYALGRDLTAEEEAAVVAALQVLVDRLILIPAPGFQDVPRRLTDA